MSTANMTEHMNLSGTHHMSSIKPSKQNYKKSFPASTI